MEKLVFVTSPLLFSYEFHVSTSFPIMYLGLDDQGLYRVAGVSSKFTKLLQIGLGRC